MLKVLSYCKSKTIDFRVDNGKRDALASLFLFKKYSDKISI